MLVVSGGPSRRVGTNGVLIGREQDCDVVGADPTLSRRHALVRRTATGAEVLPLGRQPVNVNGKDFHKPRELADGDKIALPGLKLSVQISEQRPDPHARATFRLQHGQDSFGVTHSPFVVGGHDSDDLIMPKWPAHALALHVAQRELFVEVSKGKATRNGVAIEPETLEPLVRGDELAYRGRSFTIHESIPNAAATTALSSTTKLPTKVTIEMLPRGGRVAFVLDDGTRTVFLHDRRLDFLMALLRPPPGYQPGDFIPDEAVIPIVWPRNPGASRTDINVLILRCRKELVEAGLAGPRLIERAPTGGATRIALAPGAIVVLQG